MVGTYPGMVASLPRIDYTLVMAKTTKAPAYDLPPVDVGDDEPPETIGKKTTYWNDQVRELKALSETVHADLYDEDDAGNRVLPTGLVPNDVKKGWRFYVNAQGKAHDIPKKFPGIERRQAPHNGKAGLWMRYNPVLAAKIAGETAESTNTPAEDGAETAAK